MISVGFYRKQFIFFLSLAVLLIGTGWTIDHQRSFASGRPLAVPIGTENLAVTLAIADGGIVSIDSVPIRGTISFGKQQDQFRYLLLDSPNQALQHLGATITFPRPVLSNAAKISTIITRDTVATWQAAWSDPQTVILSVDNLDPSALVTVVIDFPSGIVQPSFAQRFFGTIQSLPQVIWLSLAVVLPILTLMILLLILSVEWRRRRSNKPLTSRPTPPMNLQPAAVAALVDGRVSTRALAATILDLAARGYLAIGSHDQTFTFTKLQRSANRQDLAQLEPFEQSILDKIIAAQPQTSVTDFQIRIGQSIFSRAVAEAYLGIYESVTRRGYFVDNPAHIQGTYRLVGLSCFFVSLTGFLFGSIYFAQPATPLLLWVGMMTTGALIIYLAPRMSTHTPAGLQAARDWSAFRAYLGCEPTAQPLSDELYYRYLPYAIALGVEVAWTAQFLRTPFQPPPWYASADLLVRLEDFANDLFPLLGFLSRELAAVKEPTLS